MSITLQTVIHVFFSPAQLADAGIPYVILGEATFYTSLTSLNSIARAGHSERRTLFHETSELVAKKTKAALDGSLSVILCVGETLQERGENMTTNVVEAQLKAAVALLNENDFRSVYSTSSIHLPSYNCDT